jgi:penicillin amidase
VWLDPLPVRGFLCSHSVKSFEEFRRFFAAWPAMPLNVMYADSRGTIGWQLAGQLPQRRGGTGLIPRPADVPDSGWESELLPFEKMSFAVNPECGFMATANDEPGSPEWFGADYVDPYRAATIRDEVSKRADWNAAACEELQQNVRSMPWEAMRDTVLSLVPSDASTKDALDLLRAWDGHVGADSSAAAVYELFVAEMCVRVAKAKAPVGWLAALGELALGGEGHSLFSDRRVGHLVRLLREQPAGWFSHTWSDVMLDVLGGVVKRLRKEFGPGPDFWVWGNVRQLKLTHPLFAKSRLLGPAFNLGPVSIGGDANTISQAGCRPADPTAFTHNMANLRAVFDLSDVSRSTFVLCGGQSGNPCSPHFADQFPLWQGGETITIPWEQPAVIRSATEVLRLVPEQRSEIRSQKSDKTSNHAGL